MITVNHHHTIAVNQSVILSKQQQQRSINTHLFPVPSTDTQSSPSASKHPLTHTHSPIQFRHHQYSQTANHNATLLALLQLSLHPSAWLTWHHLHHQITILILS